ncbi:MAG TPA: helix-turn-helix transcriptional regulator [Phenylobacterium sp.]|nr:helix-turn-helix transcriptional regulator [Phenylobacterium sp.]
MYSALSDHSYRAFVTHLVAARHAAGVSQRELAGRLGRQPSYVAKTERYERRLDPAEFWAWCSALGLDASETFTAVIAELNEIEP